RARDCVAAGPKVAGSADPRGRPPLMHSGPTLREDEARAERHPVRREPSDPVADDGGRGPNRSSRERVPPRDERRANGPLTDAALEEDALLERVQAGDVAAFDAVVRQHLR